MSLTKVFKAPLKLFSRDVITFLVVRRYDLGSVEDKLRYIAVRPRASVSVLRHKIWHLLELPDYCEEVIILKAGDVAVPLSDLRKGNDPQHPYLLEVWPPGRRGLCSSLTSHNMLTMGQSVVGVVMANGSLVSSETTCNETGDYKRCDETDSNNTLRTHTISKDTVPMSKSNISPVTQVPNNYLKLGARGSELTCGISSTSLFFKMSGKKSRDNFTTILFKMQSDLLNLGNKISDLENRLPH